MMQRCPRHQAHGNVIKVAGIHQGSWLVFLQRGDKQLLLIGGEGARFISVTLCVADPYRLTLETVFIRSEVKDVSQVDL